MNLSKSALIAALLFSACADDPRIRVGSKRFTESYVLAEIAATLLRENGYEIQNRQGLGGTIIAWEALKSGEIDLYPDYTGTIREAILKVDASVSNQQIREILAGYNIGMSGELGFNNTYALVMRRERAEQLNIRSISDLQQHPDIRIGLTHEFLNRGDGWAALRDFYRLNLPNVRGLEHALAYSALNNREIDLMDAYSTDAKLAEYDLAILSDDRQFFPKYDAVFLYRLNLPDDAVAVLQQLEHRFDEALMIRLNAAAEKARNYKTAAALFFDDGSTPAGQQAADSLFAKIMRWTLRHLQLVFISMILALAIGLPLGIRASRPGVFSQIILGSTGVVQTIPSLALLALFAAIPFLGIGTSSAIVALFAYSLLPIVRNTAAGLQNIPGQLRESATALGLEPLHCLTRIYLPIASRTILAGVKTSAIINVGTATLAALIGAGGLGEPIISGLALNDSETILQGALPAALLAILVQLFFELLDRLIIPKGLRLAGPKES